MLKVRFKRKIYCVKERNLIEVLMTFGENEKELLSKIKKLKKLERHIKEIEGESGALFLKGYGLHNELFLKKVNDLNKK